MLEKNCKSCNREQEVKKRPENLSNTWTTKKKLREAIWNLIHAPFLYHVVYHIVQHPTL